MKEHEYTKMKVSDLIPYANNSRTHSDEQVNQVSSSIKEFGFTNPVLIDEDNGIIAGHGRIMAANKLGIDEVPCVVLKGLTEAQKKAYVIADNQLALNSGWDLDMLRLEVESLQEVDFNIDLLGFDDEMLSQVLVEIDDIEEVDSFNESFNFSVSCSDLSELALVQAALGATGKKIDASKLLELLS